MRSSGTTSACVIHSFPSASSICTRILNIHRLNRLPSRPPFHPGTAHVIRKVPDRVLDGGLFTPAPHPASGSHPSLSLSFPCDVPAAARPGPPLIQRCHSRRAPASRQNSRIAAAVGVPLDDFNAMEMVRRWPPSRSSPRLRAARRWAGAVSAAARPFKHSKPPCSRAELFENRSVLWILWGVFIEAWDARVLLGSPVPVHWVVTAWRQAFLRGLGWNLCLSAEDFEIWSKAIEVKALYMHTWSPFTPYGCEPRPLAALTAAGGASLSGSLGRSAPRRIRRRERIGWRWSGGIRAPRSSQTLSRRCLWQVSDRPSPPPRTVQIRWSPLHSLFSLRRMPLIAPLLLHAFHGYALPPSFLLVEIHVNLLHLTDLGVWAGGARCVWGGAALNVVA